MLFLVFPRVNRKIECFDGCHCLPERLWIGHRPDQYAEQILMRTRRDERIESMASQSFGEEHCHTSFYRSDLQINFPDFRFGK